MTPRCAGPSGCGIGGEEVIGPRRPHNPTRTVGKMGDRLQVLLLAGRGGVIVVRSSIDIRWMRPPDSDGGARSTWFRPDVGSSGDESPNQAMGWPRNASLSSSGPAAFVPESARSTRPGTTPPGSGRSCSRYSPPAARSLQAPQGSRDTDARPGRPAKSRKIPSRRTHTLRTSSASHQS